MAKGGRLFYITCLFKEHDKRGEVVLHHLGLFEDHGKGWKVVLHNLRLLKNMAKEERLFYITCVSLKNMAKGERLFCGAVVISFLTTCNNRTIISYKVSFLT